MGQYLIDTNTASNLLQAKLPEKGIVLMRTIVDAVPNLSVITKIELLSYKTSDQTESLIKDFISDSNVIALDDEITDVCIDIRRKKNIKTPDAIIAATAIVYNYTLVTGNEKDFANIKGLKIVNPHKL
jgi:predicted nucleic acid-binding protein